MSAIRIVYLAGAYSLAMILGTQFFQHVVGVAPCEMCYWQRWPLEGARWTDLSARLTEDTFLVKASGTSLGILQKDDVVECRMSPVLAMLDENGLTDQQIDDALLASRVDQKAKKPSVEAVFHAWALSLPWWRSWRP